MMTVLSANVSGMAGVSFDHKNINLPVATFEVLKPPLKPGIPPVVGVLTSTY